MQLDITFDDSDSRGKIVAGADEVGRGPLAGDVVAAAVILDPERPILELNDSKKLSAEQRENLSREIQEKALCYAVARASVQEIDRINILQASLLAMHRAVKKLSTQPGFVYVDGPHCPKWRYPSTGVIGGDGRVACIAAASILAKVVRDAEMRRLCKRYPGYGFASNKGYATRVHREALSRLGPCRIHRQSFKPVAQWKTPVPGVEPACAEEQTLGLDESTVAEE